MALEKDLIKEVQITSNFKHRLKFLLEKGKLGYFFNGFALHESSRFKLILGIIKLLQ